MQEIARLAQEVQGEGFLDVRDAEISDLIMTDREDYTPEQLEELANYEEEKEKMEDEEKSFNATKLVETINLIENAADTAMTFNQIVVRSLNFKRICDDAMKIYADLYKDVLRRAKQQKFTEYFTKQI